MWRTTTNRHDIHHGRDELKANSGNAETLETPLLRHWSIWSFLLRSYAVLLLAGLLSNAVADAANLPSLRSDLRRWPPLQQVSLFLSLFFSLSRWTRSRLADGDLITALLTWEICENSADFSPDFSCEFYFKSFHMRFWHEKSGEFSGEISPEKSPEIFQHGSL